jgi:hypothetical protein
LVGALEDIPKFVKRFDDRFKYELKVKHLRKGSREIRDKYAKLPNSIYKQVESICEPDLYVYANVLRNAENA